MENTSKNVMGKKNNKEEDGKDAFRALTQKALSVGITPGQIAQLHSVKRLRAPNKVWYKLKQKFSPLFWPMLISWVVLVALLAAVWMTEWPISRRSLLLPYFEFMNMDIEKDYCIVEIPEPVLDVARPPVDCNMCRGIDSVEKVSGITPKEFEEKYAYTGRPVVVTDAMQNWTAKDTFSFDFFKSIYSEDSPALENIEQNCQFFPYKTDFYSLGDVFNMSDDRAHMKDGSEPWYIGWSNCDSSAANILRKHYKKPYFLPEIAETSKTDWIFMGSPGYGAHMHIDNVGNPSWQAQIKGIKKWTLEPPPECYYECTPQIEVTVSPGEIIILDTNRWFHSTLILGEEMSIVITTEYD